MRTKVNDRPIDLLNGVISYLETCRAKLHGWAFCDDPPYSVEPDLLARQTHLEAWMAFNSPGKYLKKHRRDDMTLEDVSTLMRAAGQPIRNLRKEWTR
jgi:hypothetical protein